MTRRAWVILTGRKADFTEGPIGIGWFGWPVETERPDLMGCTIAFFRTRKLATSRLASVRSSFKEARVARVSIDITWGDQ